VIEKMELVDIFFIHFYTDKKSLFLYEDASDDACVVNCYKIIAAFVVKRIATKK
jgi:hypothetical protein